MRMKSLILIFIALGCGLVASIGISQVMERGGKGGGQVEMEQILVALSDIDIGTKLDAQNVKLEDWPKAKIQEGALRSLEDVEDQFANARFIKGEPILIGKITDKPGNVAVQIPEGYRAMPVKVDEDTVMKAITPGDRVDVMVFVRRGEGIPETGVFTILKNVRVFAVNSNIERSTDPKGGETNFRTVSLLVKPDHARELVLASQVGKINLTLRRPDEQDDVTEEEVTPIAEILGGKADLASDPVVPGSTSPVPTPGFNAFLNGAAQPATPPQPAEMAWSMQVFGPNGTEQYDWSDLKSLPVKTGTGLAPTVPVSIPVPAGTTGEETNQEESADATANDSAPHDTTKD
jgi:pilus assembly protein CpaB